MKAVIEPQIRDYDSLQDVIQISLAELKRFEDAGLIHPWKRNGKAHRYSVPEILAAIDAERLPKPIRRRGRKS